MSWKAALALALTSVALGLIAWGLMTGAISARFIGAREIRSAEDLLPVAGLVEPEPVHVYLNGDGSVRVGDTPSSPERLVGDIVDQATSPDKTMQGIVLHENVEVSHADYTAVMDRIRAAGWRRIELDTQRGNPK